MELLTAAEAARLVGRDARTVRRWVVDEQVPELGIVIGGRIYVRRAILEELAGAGAPTADQT